MLDRWSLIRIAALVTFAAVYVQSGAKATAEIIVASQDTYARGRSDRIGEFAQGNAVNLFARTRSNSSTADYELPMFRFDLTSLQGKTLTSAAFKITTNQAHSTAFGFNLFGATETTLGAGGTWSDSSLTYSSAPGVFDDSVSVFTEAADPRYDMWDLIPNGNSGNTGLLYQELSGTATTVGVTMSISPLNTVVSFGDPALMAFLQAAIDANQASVTLVMPTTSPNAFRFYAREATDDQGTVEVDASVTNAMRPHLDILYIPEPSSCVLGIMGSIGLAYMRSRRRE